jgi:hypothetical protein
MLQNATEMIEAILVSYNQICVFDPALANPFNDWTEDHVRQGFSWRPGSVSFGALENTETDIVVAASDSMNPDPSAFRIITVPFTVPAGGHVVVGSIGDERQVAIAPGVYQLSFELAKRERRPWCRLSFVANSNPHAEIIKTDSELTKSDVLVMIAHPAA